MRLSVLSLHSIPPQVQKAVTLRAYMRIRTYGVPVLVFLGSFFFLFSFWEYFMGDQR